MDENCVNSILIRNSSCTADSLLEPLDIWLSGTSSVVNQALRIRSHSIASLISKFNLGGEKALSEKDIKTLTKFKSRMASRCTPLGLFAGITELPLSSESASNDQEVIFSNREFWKAKLAMPASLDFIVSNQIVKDSLKDCNISFFLNPTLTIKLSYLRYYQKSDVLQPAINRLGDAFIGMLYQKNMQYSYDELEELYESIKFDSTNKQILDFVSYLNDLLENQIIFANVKTHDKSTKKLESLYIDEVAEPLRKLQSVEVHELSSLFSESLDDFNRNIHSLLQDTINKQGENTQQYNTIPTLYSKIDSGKISKNAFDNLQKLIELLPQFWVHRLQSLIDSVIHVLIESLNGQSISILRLTALLAPEKEQHLGKEESGLLDKISTTNKLESLVQGNKDLQDFTEKFKSLLIEKLTLSNNVVELSTSELVKLSGNRALNKAPGNWLEVFSLLKSKNSLPLFSIYNAHTDPGRYVNRLLDSEETPYSYSKITQIYKEQEAAYLEINCILAEIDWSPEGLMADVMKRPLQYSYTINVFEKGAEKNSISLTDIEISFKAEDGLIAWSKSLNKRVIPSLKSAYNAMLVPLPVQLLLACNPEYATWQLPSMEHLGIEKSPAIHFGNVELYPQTWALPLGLLEEIKNYSFLKKNYIEIDKKFQCWCRHQGVPQIIRPSVFEANLIDLNGKDALLLLSEYLKSTSYICEDSVITDSFSKLNHRNVVTEIISHHKLASAPNLKPISFNNITESTEFHGPGSEWVYLKVFCEHYIKEHLIVYILDKIKNNMVLNKQIVRYFFVRYNEGGSHIRLRLNTYRFNQVFNEMSNLLNQCLADELITSWLIDTYRKEESRYGGKLGMLIAEEIFTLDSQLSGLILINSLASDDPTERLPLWGLFVHTMLSGMGFSSIEQRVTFLANTHVKWAKEFDVSTEEKKRLKKDVRMHVSKLAEALKVIGDERLLSEVYGQEVATVLSKLHVKSTEFVHTLIVSNQKLSIHKVADSLIHMHSNRVFGSRYREFIARHVLLTASRSHKHLNQLS